MASNFTTSIVKHNVFVNNPVVIVDAGVSGGFEKHWHLFKTQKVMYGFEARGVPSMRTGPYEGQVTVFPVALSDKTEKKVFYVTANRHSASLFKPIHPYVDRFHGFENLKIIEPREIEVRDLESFAGENKLLPFDFVKIDCEGAELDILVGAGNRLDSVIGVSVEALYQDWRDGQPTFRDIDQFMHNAGFKLHNAINYHIMKTVAHKTSRKTSGSDGQLMWGQFIYIKDFVDDIASCTPMQIIKAACYMEIYELRDCALELLLHSIRYKVNFGFDMNPFVGLLR